MVFFLSRHDENKARIWEKSIRFDFKNSLGKGLEDVLRKASQKWNRNQESSQFFKCWPSSRFLKNFQNVPPIAKGTNRNQLFFQTSLSTWLLSILIGWNWIIASKSRITFLHYLQKNLLCYNKSWLSRKPALKWWIKSNVTQVDRNNSMKVSLLKFWKSDHYLGSYRHLSEARYAYQMQTFLAVKRFDLPTCKHLLQQTLVDL